MYAIETFDVIKDYSSVRALKKVSLQVPEKVTMGLVGPNGAGKTTLFSIICGFLQPTEGEIHIMGTPIRKGIKRGILSVLPQDARFMKYIPIRVQFVRRPILPAQHAPKFLYGLSAFHMSIPFSCKKPRELLPCDRISPINRRIVPGAKRNLKVDRKTQCQAQRNQQQRFPAQQNLPIGA